MDRILLHAGSAGRKGPPRFRLSQGRIHACIPCCLRFCSRRSGRHGWNWHGTEHARLQLADARLARPLPDLGDVPATPDSGSFRANGDNLLCLPVVEAHDNRGFGFPFRGGTPVGVEAGGGDCDPGSCVHFNLPALVESLADWALPRMVGCSLLLLGARAGSVERDVWLASMRTGPIARPNDEEPRHVGISSWAPEARSSASVSVPWASVPVRRRRRMPIRRYVGQSALLSASFSAAPTGTARTNRS